MYVSIFVEGSYFLQILKTIILYKCLACFYNNIFFLKDHHIVENLSLNRDN